MECPGSTGISGEAVAPTIRSLFAINLEKITRARGERVRDLNAQRLGAVIYEVENDKHRSADDVLFLRRMEMGGERGRRRHGGGDQEKKGGKTRVRGHGASGVCLSYIFDTGI